PHRQRLGKGAAGQPAHPWGLRLGRARFVARLGRFCLARGVAVLGVIAYRLVNFWLPIPVGAGCYLWLRSDGEGGRIKRAEALRKMMKEAASARRDGSREKKTGPEAS